MLQVGSPAVPPVKPPMVERGVVLVVAELFGMFQVGSPAVPPVKPPMVDRGVSY